MALLALAGLSWHLTRPALWIDESASVVATQRHWAGLFRLLHGSDAPLVPYYALLKVTSELTTQLWPGAADHPELLFRWPSLLVSVLAVGLLALWLGRQVGVRPAVCAGAVLLLCPSTSFYGQEARPYAFALAAAIAAGAAWTRLVQEPGPRWVILYALSVAVLVDSHLLAGSLLAAHLVAAIVRPVPDPTASSAGPVPSDHPGRRPPHGNRNGRRRGVGATLLAGAIGLVLAAPFAGFAARHGRGVRDAGNTTTLHDLLNVFTQLFTQGHGHRLVLRSILVLALVGLGRVRSSRYAAMARLATCWAIIPLVLLAPLMVARPGLLQPRYALFVLPGWAVLAAIGLCSVMDVVARALTRGAGVAAPTEAGPDARPAARPDAGRPAAAAGPLRPSPAGPGLLGRLVAAALGVLVLAGLAVQQRPAMQEVRAAGGHKEDIRPSLALADSPAYAGLPIVLTQRNSPLEVAAYDRRDLPRLYGLRIQLDRSAIWPASTSPAQKEQQLAHATRLVLLVRQGSLRAGCYSGPDADRAERIGQCLPTGLLPDHYHYRIVSARPAGQDWTFAVMQR